MQSSVAAYSDVASWNVGGLVLRNLVEYAPASVAVLDEAGTILAVNERWRAFGRDNGLDAPHDGVGLNYLDICDRAEGPCATEAPIVARSMRNLLQGHGRAFRLEYPCFSPARPRWFLLNVYRIEDRHRSHLVTWHQDITPWKLR